MYSNSKNHDNQIGEDREDPNQSGTPRRSEPASPRGSASAFPEPKHSPENKGSLVTHDDRQ